VLTDRSHNFALEVAYRSEPRIWVVAMETHKQITFAFILAFVLCFYLNFDCCSARYSRCIRTLNK